MITHLQEDAVMLWGFFRMILSIILSLGLFLSTGRWQVLLWLSLHLALTLRRAYRLYQRAPDAAEHPEYWARFNARNVLPRSCVCVIIRSAC